MTDRELLELAAKAAGITILRSRLMDPLNSDMLVLGGSRNPHHEVGPWNPLADDGDALRLAVKLGVQPSRCFQVVIDSEIARTGVRHTDRGGKYDALEEHTTDPYAATRHAIVRAAAEIGKAME